MRLTLAPDLAAVRQAREFVREECRAGHVDSDASDTAVLLTSEAVTNAFTHGRSDARITVTLCSSGLRVEVADDNSRHPQRVAADVQALDGRGMTIIDLLASSWGVTDDPFGKTVWFEVHRVGGRPAP